MHTCALTHVHTHTHIHKPSTCMYSFHSLHYVTFYWPNACLVFWARYHKEYIRTSHDVRQPTISSSFRNYITTVRALISTCHWFPFPSRPWSTLSHISFFLYDFAFSSIYSSCLNFKCLPDIYMLKAQSSSCVLQGDGEILERKGIVEGCSIIRCAHGRDIRILSSSPPAMRRDLL